MRRTFLVALLLLLTACSGGSSGQVSPTTATSSTASAATALSTSSASSVETTTSAAAPSATATLAASVPAPTATASATSAASTSTSTSTKAAAATPTARPTTAPTAAPATAAWPTYHGANNRRGDAQASVDPAATKSVWQSEALDGQVYAEPLVAGDRLYIATEGDSVYALNVTNGSVVWKTNLGKPVPGSALPCGDVDPVGITSTPVLDPGHGLLYTVAFAEPGKHTLFALHLDNGKVAWQRGIDPPNDDPHVLNQRGALALANDTVYVPYGGRDGDCGDYHGWVMGAPASGSGDLLSYRVPTAGGGGFRDGGAGIWAPGGESVDSGGNVFVATGNGGSTNFDYSDSVIKLSPKLQVQDYFAPSNWQALSRSDLDLGSENPVLMDNGLVFVIGKEGVGYLLHADNLGKIGGQAHAAQVCSGAAFNATAYAASMLYVPCGNGVTALHVSGTSFTVAWRGPNRPAGAPIVAGNTVWVVDRRGTLYALDAASGQVRFQTAIPAPATSFPSLAAAGNRLYVPAGTRVLAFGSS